MLNSLRTYLASQSIKSKLRLSSIANAAALVIMIGCVAIGGKIAMDLRAQRMAISEATVASAKLDKFAGRARLSYQAALDGDAGAYGEAKWALGKARSQLAVVRRLTEEAGLEFGNELSSVQSEMIAFGSAIAGTAAGADVEAALAAGEQLSSGAATLDAALDAAAVKADETSRQRITLLFGMFVAIFVLGVVITLASARFLARDIIRSLTAITDAARDFASGNRNIDVPGLDRGDEIGELARAFGMARDGAIQLDAMLAERAALRGQRAEEMKQLASHFEASIGDIVGGVAAASSQLQATASAMAAAAEQASSQSGLVAMSMDRASSGVTAAAAASDEFAMSIGEISRQATSSAELARRATDAATRADATISALDASANQVGQIVELISSIAQRTNLLALNASIEAARGGEAGRGFAVVASEVKELAAQTSRATDEIAAQIRAMQDSTGASVNALRSIGEQIKSLETTAISIASAVDQQSVAGQDLARSIDLAARSSDEVAANIGQVREASNSTGAAASQVLTSATELEGQASSLRHKVNDFLAHVRAS